MGNGRRVSDAEIVEIKTDVKEMKLALLGDIENKKDGFITRHRLTEESLRRLWKFTGAIAFAISLKMIVSIFGI